jgi:hypothetical protein
MQNYLRIFLLFLTFSITQLSKAQTVIATWTFDPLQGTNSSPIPNVGAGTATIVAGVGTITGGAGTGVTGLGCGAQTSGNNAWALNPFTPGNANEINGVEFTVNTLGQSNIALSWDMRLSNTAPNTIRLKYSTDGVNWSDFNMDNSNTTFCLGTLNNGRFEANNASGDQYRRISVNLATISALNDQPMVKFRLLAAHFQNTGQFRQTNNNTTVATGGTWRFDNVSIVGFSSTLPEVNLSVSANTGTEANSTVLTLTATASTPVLGNQNITLNITGTGITTDDYTLNRTIITIPSGTTTGTATFTIVDDALAEGTETATVTLNNPSWGVSIGANNSVLITITDNDALPNTNPTIKIDASTSNAIDGGFSTTASPFAVTASMADPSDPMQFQGINFEINDAETMPADLTVSVSSSNMAVAPLSNIVLSGSGSIRNVKITPAGVGYATITVNVSDGIASTNFIINYAASQAALTATTTRFYAGTSDASTVIGIDANYMIVGDDEDQALRIYDRNQSGLPIASFDFSNDLALSTNNREVDIESSVRVGNRIYWLGSHTNSTSGALRPNRYRFFATDVNGVGAATVLNYVGRFDNLRTDLLNWDATNLHGLGNDFFGLRASAAVGVIPEEPSGAGFNIEGLTIAPNQSTAYICFRAPIVPAANRTKALIVPWLNFEAMVAGNPTNAVAQFGAPIQLDLGGRGIREIKRNANGEYIIIAGPCDVATGIAPKDFKLYTWSGNANDAPIITNTDLTAVQAMGSFEGIVDVPNLISTGATLQLLVDNGDNVYYNDGIIAKELPQSNLKKFRSDIISIVLAPPFVSLKAKVFLGGTFNITTNKMNDDLRTANIIPLTAPYTNLGYTQIGGGNETTTSAVINQNSSNNVVDWILVELRNANNTATIVATRAGLLRQNGDIVDTDGVSPLKFNQLSAGNYFVVIRHRNHLGFRTLNSIALSQNVTDLNFTNNATPLYGSTPQNHIGNGIFSMIAGDANRDGSIDAFDSIVWENQNGLFDDYTLNGDYNMDGSVDALDSIVWEINNGKFEEIN